MKFVKTLLLGLLLLIHRGFILFSEIIENIFPSLYIHWDRMWIAYRENKKTNILHKLDRKAIPFSFYTPNLLAQYRANSFSTKEPETLAWIDYYGTKEGVLFDIGANVGLYSIYHAVTKQGITYAFEPSAFNLKLLVKNINLNNCQDRIKLVSNPLTAINSFANFNLQSTEDGAALSSFGVDYGHDGTKLNTKVSYQTLGFSLDYLIEHNIIEHIPAIIKIDVDGIEHLILQGAKKLLSNPVCKSVLIEVNDYFIELASEVDSILTGSGFILKSKSSVESDLLEPGSNFTFNQIWVKA